MPATTRSSGSGVSSLLTSPGCMPITKDTIALFEVQARSGKDAEPFTVSRSTSAG
jgi:hypothetical protein